MRLASAELRGQAMAMAADTLGMTAEAMEGDGVSYTITERGILREARILLAEHLCDIAGPDRLEGRGNLWGRNVVGRD